MQPQLMHWHLRLKTVWVSSGDLGQHVCISQHTSVACCQRTMLLLMASAACFTAIACPIQLNQWFAVS
jgi:hypothetical protein